MREYSRQLTGNLTPDHRSRLRDRIRILRGSSHPLEVLIDHHLPADDIVHTIIRLLPLDLTGPVYHVEALDGTLRLVRESEVAPAE